MGRPRKDQQDGVTVEQENVSVGPVESSEPEPVIDQKDIAEGGALPEIVKVEGILLESKESEKVKELEARIAYLESLVKNISLKIHLDDKQVQMPEKKNYNTDRVVFGVQEIVSIEDLNK